jgi:hypothetical protein
MRFKANIEEQTFSFHKILRKMDAKKPEQQPAQVAPKSIVLRKVTGAYPPHNLNVADNAIIHEKWETHLANNPLSDARQNGGKRLGIHLRDYSKQQYISKEDEDLWAFDTETKKFHTQVAQNVIKDKTELRILTSIITDHLNKVDKTLRVSLLDFCRIFSQKRLKLNRKMIQDTLLVPAIPPIRIKLGR